MLSNVLSFPDGRVIKDDFIDIDKPLGIQEDDLYEDMFQVLFNDNYAIDVGWYGEDIKSGCFKCYLLQNEDWENPVKVEETKDHREVSSIVIKLNEYRLKMCS